MTTTSSSSVMSWRSDSLKALTYVISRIVATSDRVDVVEDVGRIGIGAVLRELDGGHDLVAGLLPDQLDTRLVGGAGRDHPRLEGGDGVTALPLVDLLLRAVERAQALDALVVVVP